MKRLNCVNQRWAIMLLENVRANFDDTIRSDAQEMAIECGMM